MATLADTIGGTVPTPAPPAEQQQMEADLEVMEQSDSKMMEETEAQQSDSLGPATKDASKA